MYPNFFQNKSMDTLIHVRYHNQNRCQASAYHKLFTIITQQKDSEEKKDKETGRFLI